MAAGDNTATGVRIVHESLDPTWVVKAKVPGNVEISRGAPVEVLTSGDYSGTIAEFTTAAVATDADDFLGIALTANEGDEAAAVRNEVSVAIRCVADVTFSTAPATTDYIGTGVECDSAGGGALNHVFTFCIEASGVNQIGWLMETGDGSSTTRKVLFDSMQVIGQRVAGAGLWEQTAAE